MKFQTKYFGFRHSITSEIYIGHDRWFAGIWRMNSSIGAIVGIIRLGNFAIRLKNGPVYFSERHGYDVPLLRFAGWRLFVDKSKKLRL